MAGACSAGSSLDGPPGTAGGLPESGRRSPGATGATSGQATKTSVHPAGVTDKLDRYDNEDYRMCWPWYLSVTPARVNSTSCWLPGGRPLCPGRLPAAVLQPPGCPLNAQYQRQDSPESNEISCSLDFKPKSRQRPALSFTGILAVAPACRHRRWPVDFAHEQSAYSRRTAQAERGRPRGNPNQARRTHRRRLA